MIKEEDNINNSFISPLLDMTFNKASKISVEDMTDTNKTNKFCKLVFDLVIDEAKL